MSVFFDSALDGFPAAKIDFLTATIKIALCRGYTIDAADEFVSDLTGVTQVAVATLASKTILYSGSCYAANPTFTSVAAGAACDSLIVYQASAVGGGADVATSAQRLICVLDSATVTGLPVTPNGSDIALSITTYLFSIND